MKHFFLLALVLACFSLTAHAQQWTDVVYLKNGSIIRGTVIEQTPGQSLKVQTSDGSIFVYEMAEVEKITKEQVSSSVVKSQNGLSDDILDGKLVFSNGNLSINGTQLNDRTAISLIGASDYNDYKRIRDRRILFHLISGFGIGISAGSLKPLLTGLFSNESAQTRFGLIALGVGVATAVTGFVLLSDNSRKINSILDRYNRENGYAFQDWEPVPAVRLGLHRPLIMETTPLFAYAITF